MNRQNLIVSLLLVLTSSYALSHPINSNIAGMEGMPSDHLHPYKTYLEKGTYEGQDWSCFSVPPKSRYDTFKAAFDLFYQMEGKVIVELGTSRSFTHGGLPGCNLDAIEYWTPNQPENWDWGAGFFTRMAANCFAGKSLELHTVDISLQHINRCKIMTEDYQDIIHYHVASSVDFLTQCDFPSGIHLLYMDTGDTTPIESSALLHLEEAVIIVERGLIAEGGLILIDDVRNQTPKAFGDTSGLGKSKYSLPYLLSNGFEIISDEYQVLLKKISN